MTAAQDGVSFFEIAAGDQVAGFALRTSNDPVPRGIRTSKNQLWRLKGLFRRSDTSFRRIERWYSTAWILTKRMDHAFKRGVRTHRATSALQVNGNG